MTDTLNPLRSNELFGCPLLESIQPAPTILKEISQRAGRRIQNAKKRGGAP